MSERQSVGVRPYTDEELQRHLAVDTYGDFVLTDAIRPSFDLQVIPVQGYRRERYRDPKGADVPLIAAAVTRQQLFDVFLDLLDPLGEMVDTVLETDHDQNRDSHRDLFREQIDLPVLKSHFCEYEDLLMNDGCTGVAVISNDGPGEVQFDGHKLLVIYARNLTPFEEVLRTHGIERNDRMKLITEGEHLHSTDEKFERAFEELACRVGVSLGDGRGPGEIPF